jgi:hypothetical protein
VRAGVSVNVKGTRKLIPHAFILNVHAGWDEARVGGGFHPRSQPKRPGRLPIKPLTHGGRAGSLSRSGSQQIVRSPRARSIRKELRPLCAPCNQGVAMAIEKGVGFPITAKDQFSAAFDKLKGKVTEAQGGFRQAQGRYDRLVCGVSVAGFGMIGAARDRCRGRDGQALAENRHCRNQLSKLAYGAELSDVSMETFGKGMKAFAGKIGGGDGQPRARRPSSSACSAWT